MLRTIKLPEPPGSTSGVPEIFNRGISSVVRRAVIIGNGAPGAENQCIGLVRALGLQNDFTLYRVNRPQGGYNYWLRWLPLSVHKKIDSIIRYLQRDFRYLPLSPLFGSKGSYFEQKALSELSGLIPDADVRKIAALAAESFEREGPLLVVASGRDTASIAAQVKRLTSQNTFVVHIQHPRSDLNQFDMVITPQHDYHILKPGALEEVPRFLRPWLSPRTPPEKHVVLTVGALHDAGAARLRLAAANWHDELAPLPKPLIVVNIGGPTRHCKYGTDVALELALSLKRVLATCGSVCISFSRRTPSKIVKVICNEISDNPKIFIWDGQGRNPHLGHLAWADAFVITADSISMLSEACSTGKPVYVIGGERCKWKFAEFYKGLQKRGVIRPFTGTEDMAESWSYPPLNDTMEAADRVRQALAERSWGIG